MIISFNTVDFSWEAGDNGTNNLIIMCRDIGTLPVTETDRVTLESAIKIAVAKAVNE